MCLVDAPRARTERYRVPVRARGSAGSEGVGNLDLAGDDLLLVGVDLVLDVVELPTAGRVADTVALEVVDVEARLGGAVLVGLGEVVDRDVDALERRGQDVLLLLLGSRQVLVGVHADSELLRG